MKTIHSHGHRDVAPQERSPPAMTKHGLQICLGTVRSGLHTNRRKFDSERSNHHRSPLGTRRAGCLTKARTQLRAMTGGPTDQPPGPIKEDRRGFWALIAAQFLGAFNDNAWKMALLWLARVTIANEEERTSLVALASALFMAPFALFSMQAGAISDRFSKRTVLNWAKGAEMVILGLGVVVFLSGGSFWALLAVLFLMGTHSTYYGPAKYGVLPEILPPERLSWGNGVLELFTFLAIILGTVAGTALPPLFKPTGAPIAGSNLYLLALCLFGLSMTGWLLSLLLGRVPSADPKRRVSFNPLQGLVAKSRLVFESRVLWLTLLGTVYFWAVGALALQNIQFYGESALGLGPEDVKIGFLNVALALGIGAGGFACGYLSGKTIELGLVPLGALGLSAFSVALYFTAGSYALTVTALSLLGFAGGIFIVPLNALLQEASPPENKGSVIAVSQVYCAVAMALASGLQYVLKETLGLSPRTIFLVAGIATFAGTAYTLSLLPEALGRLLLWLLTRTFYRIRILGRENLPERGPALIVSNHVSYVDGLLLLATTHRFIRFVMYKAIADLPAVRPVARLMKVIPISSEEGPKAVIRAFQDAEEALRRGELVCIFPEGQISRIGQLLPFRKGFERILKNVDAPVIPVHLDCVWGSIFSFEGGKFLWKRPRRIPYPVTVSFGKPLSRTVSAFEVRQRVQELGSEAFPARLSDLEPLDLSFARTARRLKRSLALVDSLGTKVTFLEALERSLGLARKLRAKWAGQERVGILLPPSVGGALANVAALFSGHVPVNLNYTASRESIRAASELAGLKTVLTSRTFLEKFPVELPAEAIYLEDFKGNVPLVEKLKIGLAARFLPRSSLRRFCGSDAPPDSSAIATILFSSGSTGEPKGALLTHTNLLSNVSALEQLFGPRSTDRVLGVLPFFHSFGIMGTLWFPLVAGIGAVYHPSPLDARAVAHLAREYGCTYLLATPTFLQMYTRRCEPEAFGSLRNVVVGAEKLTDRVADAFRDRFGIEPLEGYGCTECSPLVAVNVPDHRERGIHQVGQKRGRIGHPIPGVTVRIVDPETFQPLEQGARGLLLVKGPNVMQGYLNRPDLTENAIRDGWYVTGDIAEVDEDGFITITDRLSRFSKIAGEMVPHIKVEGALHDLLSKSEQVLAVTSLPDPEKGERLAVVHTLPDAELETLITTLPASGLPNLWLPKREAFVYVESLPLLGSGKLDLRKLREVAAERVGTK